MTRDQVIAECRAARAGGLNEISTECAKAIVWMHRAGALSAAMAFVLHDRPPAGPWDWQEDIDVELRGTSLWRMLYARSYGRLAEDDRLMADMLRTYLFCVSLGMPV